MKITLLDMAVCFIPNSGMTTVVVSMVTRHIAVCYENDIAVCLIPNSGMTTVMVSMVTRHIAVCYENDIAVCFIPNSGMTTVVVSMVTRNIAVCYENYALRRGRLFHSELWNDYSSDFYGNQTYSGVL